MFMQNKTRRRSSAFWARRASLVLHLAVLSDVNLNAKLAFFVVATGGGRALCESA